MRVPVLRFLISSISSFGRHNSREDCEMRYCSTFNGSLELAGAPRAERRGALFDSLDCSALRFLGKPLALLVGLVLLAADMGGLWEF